MFFVAFSEYLNQYTTYGISRPGYQYSISNICEPNKRSTHYVHKRRHKGGASSKEWKNAQKKLEGFHVLQTAETKVFLYKSCYEQFFCHTLCISGGIIVNSMLFLSIANHQFCLFYQFQSNYLFNGLRTPSEEIAFTARPKINLQSQIFRYSRSIFCLPHRPNFSDFFDLCLHWVSVVRVL